MKCFESKFCLIKNDSRAVISVSLRKKPNHSESLSGHTDFLCGIFQMELANILCD